MKMMFLRLPFVQVKILRKELREREKKAIVSILSRAEVCRK